MPAEYRVKIFKSGNSLAVRLPKRLGLQAGQDIVLVRHADGAMSFWPESDNAERLDALYGSFSPGFMSEGRDDTEQDERVWSKPTRDAAA